ncbi:TPA: hypothetical protein ACHK65_005182, partial [Escherichia coli]
FKVCNDFLGDIFNEFYSGKAQDLLIENIIHLCLKVTNERSDILENLCKSKKSLPEMVRNIKPSSF